MTNKVGAKSGKKWKTMHKIGVIVHGKALFS